MSEQIVECTAKGEVVGPIDKFKAHKFPTRIERCHYSTWCMVFNPKIEKYLLQLKNPKVKKNSSDANWDMGVAGHNNYFDGKAMSFGETMVKEADEEMGLTVRVANGLTEFMDGLTKLENPTGFIFDKFHYKTERNNEFVGAGLIMTPSEKVEFKDKEAIGAKWLTPQELKKFLQENKNHSNALEMMFERTDKFRQKLKIK